MTDNSEQYEKALVAFVTEALDLRYGEYNDPEGKLRLPDPEDGLAPIMASLLRCRARLDRLEEIHARIIQLRARVNRAKEDAKWTADIAMATNTQRNQTSRSVDFSTREERNSDAMLQSIQELHTQRQREKLVSVAQESYDVVHEALWGLKSLLDNHTIVLRSFQFESSLER